MTNRTTEVACLSWGEVCARRLDRHALSAPLQDARPADIVATICGAHAQVLSAAELSIGLRLAGITRTAIRQALWTERSLVKTFGPRGTVHLLPTQDLPMWTGALTAIPPAPTGQAKNVQLTLEQAEQAVEAIAIALDDAELTIDELSEAVIASTGPWAADLVMPAFGGMWPRWRQALTTAEDIKRELSDQLCKPVAWVASVRAMMESGVGTFIEVGPGQVLSGLIKRISDEAKVVNIDDLMSGELPNGGAAPAASG